jgi:hypothetical protein
VVGGSGSGETRRLECGGVSGGCEVSGDSVKSQYTALQLGNVVKNNIHSCVSNSFLVIDRAASKLYRPSNLRMTLVEIIARFPASTSNFNTQKIFVESKM